MGFYQRLSNGWELSKLSYSVLKANTSLVIFPVLSGISLLILFGSFFTVVFASFGWELEGFANANRLLIYALTFVCYLVNYFVVVFFNMALIHCARLYFQGEEVSVAKGISFSMSRIGVILSWAIFAATIGLLLKAIQENLGWVGRIITGLIGIVWSVATFFTVPILAYEKVNPVQALKRSASLMRDKWGESLGATFSFGLVQFVIIILLGVPALLLGFLSPVAGVVFWLLGIIVVACVFSALNSIFISAVYNKVNGNTDMRFRDDMFDSLFVSK